jgi:cytochrome c oxidase subunit I
MATTTAPLTGTHTHTHPHVHEEEDTSLWSWITTVDHKRIGKLYFLSATFFFLVGGIEALLIRTQLMFPRFGFISAQTYNEMFTMHATNMIFMAVMPMSAAFFNFLIPLQIGARDVAFPRMNAFSYWLFLFGAVFTNVSLFFGAYPDGGWFGYANLTSAKYSPGASIDFWAIGLLILGTSSMAAGFNFITTVFNLRAPGMTMFRMPVFTWMALVVQFLLVLSLPMITIGLVLLVADRNYGTNFYFPENGGDPLLWQHLFWLFGHPEVYILILPAFGLISEVLPTMAGKPLFGAPFVIFSGIAIGFIGFGVWSHHMFTVGLGPVADAAFSVTTMIIAVPTAVKIFNWIATMWGGQLRFNVANLYAIGLVGLFTIGGLSGVMHAAPPIDLQHQDSYFVVAHFHYVLVGGSLMGLLSGIYFYAPKMWGFVLDETIGKVGWFLVVLGMNLTFFPMHFLGAMGMARRTFTYDAGVGWEMWNLVATLGAFTLAFGILVNLINAVVSYRRNIPAAADPWDGATLEWSLPTPIPHYNFAKIPTVHSDRPYWDEKHEGGPAVSQSAIAGPGPHHPHMPNGSYWPILAAFSQGLFMAAIMIGRGNHEFDPIAFRNQALVQVPLAIVFLLFCLAWIKEDPFAAPKTAHKH